MSNCNLFFLFLNQNICCGYSKELSQDGSFEYPKHMFKLMDKKIIAISCKLFLLNWPYDIIHFRVISRAPGLKLVVQTLLSSLRPIGNIVLICCTFFIIFGILGVQVRCFLLL